DPSACGVSARPFSRRDGSARPGARKHLPPDRHAHHDDGHRQHSGEPTRHDSVLLTVLASRDELYPMTMAKGCRSGLVGSVLNRSVLAVFSGIAVSWTLTGWPGFTVARLPLPCSSRPPSAAAPGRTSSHPRPADQ